MAVLPEVVVFATKLAGSDLNAIVSAAPSSRWSVTFTSAICESSLSVRLVKDAFVA
jgi:hypothetical protein